MTSYVGIIIFFAISLGHKFAVGRHDPWWIAPEDVDLTTGLDGVSRGKATRESRIGEVVLAVEAAV